MGLFGFLQKQSPTTATQRVDQHDALDDRTNDKIWPLVALSYTQYCATYQATFERYQLAYPGIDALPVVVNSLKLRRGYIIPTGSRPETAGIDSEQWTFAVFVTALASAIGYCQNRKSAKEFIETLVPDCAIEWLNDDVGKALVMACCGIDSSSKPLVTIARNAVAASNVDGEFVQSDFIDWVEKSVSTESSPINLQRSSIHVYDGRFFVLEKCLKRFLSERDLSFSVELVGKMILLEPIQFTVVGQKKTRTIRGYLFDSTLIATLELVDNPVLDQPLVQ